MKKLYIRPVAYAVRIDEDLMKGIIYTSIGATADETDGEGTIGSEGLDAGDSDAKGVCGYFNDFESLPRNSINLWADEDEDY